MGEDDREENVTTSGRSEDASVSKSESVSESQRPQNFKVARLLRFEEESEMIVVIKCIQCINCMEFAASPIYTCENAHVVCGSCIKNLNEICSTCKLTLTEDPVAARLAKEANVMFQCVNSDFGCSQILHSTKVLQHIASCFKREIPCYEIHGNICSGKEFFQFDNFVPHLESAHNFQAVAGPTHNIELYYPGEKTKNFQWDLRIIKFDNEMFFLFPQLIDGKFYFWVTMLGDSEKAGKYKCVLQFITPPSGPNSQLKWKIERRLTLQVFPIHECPRISKRKRLHEIFPIMCTGELETWTYNQSEIRLFCSSIEVQRMD